MVAFSTLFAGPVLDTAEVRLGSIWSPSTRAGARHHPGGWLVFHVFAALAEFIRELIVEAPCGVPELGHRS